MAASNSQANGNDQNGVGNVQVNANYANYNTMIMPWQSDYLEESQVQKSIRDKLSAIPNQMDVFRRLDETLVPGPLSLLDSFATPRQSYGSFPSPERGNQIKHYRTSPKNKRQVPDIDRYETGLEYVRSIQSCIFIISHHGYMERHRNLKPDWQKILQEKKALQNFENVFKNSIIREAIGDRFPDDPTRSLEATVASVLRLHSILTSSDNPKAPQDKRKPAHAGSRRSSRGEKKKPSTPPKDTPSRIKKRDTSVADNIKDIMQQLTLNIKRLSAVRERNFRLLNLMFAHDAYERLYSVLCNRCKQHKAHIIDFHLETTLPHKNVEFDIKFRLSIDESSVYDSTENEVQLTFSGIQGFPQVSGCLLTCKFPSRHLPGLENALLRPHSPSDAAPFNIDKSIKTYRCKLSDINHVLERQCVEGYITETELLHLGKRIATAVLKFNCTSFFSRVWDFQNIVLDFDSPGELLQEPHFSILLENSPKVDRESMLHCLGLVLYKLWSYFDRDRGKYKPDVANLDWTQFSSIRALIVERMGIWVDTGYMLKMHAEIVQWCLDAPKCTVEDMKDPEKLNEMYEKIICGLEEVEVAYHDGTLASP